MNQLAEIETVEDRKNRLVESLSTQYSLSVISVEEYERLLKYSQDIETGKELDILEKIVKEYETTRENAEENQVNGKPVKNTQNHFTLLSSRKTTGPVKNGNFKTILGGHKIILSEKDLVGEKTVLNINAVLSDVVIIVPENVSVIVKALPLLAEINIPDKLLYKDSQKKVIIKGRVILSELKVKVRR